MSTSSHSQKEQYIIRLKDHVDMEAHIRVFNGRYGQDSHNVLHKFDTRLVNAYIGEFSEEALRAIESDNNTDSILANTEAQIEDVFQVSAQEVKYYHNCIIVECDHDQQLRKPQSLPIPQMPFVFPQNPQIPVTLPGSYQSGKRNKEQRGRA